MVHAIAEERGVRMPSFFAYLSWAALILVPVFLLITFLPIAPVLRPA
ncbi:MAG: sodium:proton antiporter [Xanthobacteraceae bacterium]